MQCGKNILWRMPKELLQSLVCGDIALNAEDADSVLFELFSNTDTDWMAMVQTKSPMLYSVTLFATGHGRPKGSAPAPREWREVIRKLR
jgi:hypothetical protein